jgi:hypothetical protein
MVVLLLHMFWKQVKSVREGASSDVLISNMEKKRNFIELKV